MPAYINHLVDTEISYMATKKKDDKDKGGRPQGHELLQRAEEYVKNPAKMGDFTKEREKWQEEDKKKAEEAKAAQPAQPTQPADDAANRPGAPADHVARDPETHEEHAENLRHLPPVPSEKAGSASQAK